MSAKNGRAIDLCGGLAGRDLRLTEELVVDAVLEGVERGVPLELGLCDRSVDHDEVLAKVCVP